MDDQSKHRKTVRVRNTQDTKRPELKSTGRTVEVKRRRKRTSVTVRLPDSVVEWLRNQPESQSTVIEKALQAYQSADPTTTVRYQHNRVAPNWIPGKPPEETEIAWLRLCTRPIGKSPAEHQNILAARDGRGHWCKAVDYKARRLETTPIHEDSITHWSLYQSPC